jgi:hypothetical protein
MGPRENTARETFALADQSQKKVLGLNRNTAELTGFVPGEEKYAPRSFRVPFEHPVTYGKEETSLLPLYGTAALQPMCFSA